MGCNFCSTSAMFGGKGRFVNFYETGDALFGVMCELEKGLGAQSFFVMDENFLLHRKRALRLLELTREHDKAWSLYVFSSANTLRLYSIEELVALGVSWLWIGLEGKQSQYAKLKGADTRALVEELQANGIRVLGSTFFWHHAPTTENIDAAIDYAVSHDTEFHQFMLYTPIPGTPLYAEHLAKGTLLGEEEIPDADTHDQLRFNFRHPRFRGGQETGYLVGAFERDFEVNGPSIARIARTLLQGWLRHKEHPDPRVRRRFVRESRGLSTSYAGSLWAAERWLAHNPALVARLRATRRAIAEEFGLVSRMAAPAVGVVLLVAMSLERRRLRSGHAYEPPTFYETNRPADGGAATAPAPCRWVGLSTETLIPAE